MVDLVEYVRTQRVAGYSDAAIKTVLLNQGYTHEQIGDAMSGKKHLPRASSSPDTKKISLIISASLVALLITFILLTFVMFSNTISEDDLVVGATISLAPAEETSFMIGDDEHTVQAETISGDQATIVLTSTPTRVTLKTGEERRVDLDRDGAYDVVVRLLSINGEEAELLLTRTYDAVCTEDWQCADWQRCTEAGTQTRSCADKNNCGTTTNRPSLQQPCEYTPRCTEQWTCTAWNECSSIGFQSRTCTDDNECGTTKNKPVVSQQCTYQPTTPTTPPPPTTCKEQWTCTDWSPCTSSGTQVRVCTDNNNCGTTTDKPAQSRSCEQACNPVWYCNDWSTCVNGEQTRTCFDDNECDDESSMPATERDCDTELISCGSDVWDDDSMDTDALDCLIDASESCAPAEMRWTLTMNLFGLVQTTVTDVYLYEAPGDACLYQEVLVDNQAYFSDSFIEEALANNVTQEEIDAQEAEVQAQAEELIGMTMTCSFPQDDLTAVLESWREGSFSTSDYDTANCTTVFPE